MFSDGAIIATFSAVDVSALGITASNAVIRPVFDSALGNYSVASACTQTDVAVTNGCGPSCPVYINDAQTSQATLDVTGAPFFVVAVGYHQLFFYYQLNFNIGKKDKLLSRL